VHFGGLDYTIILYFIKMKITGYTASPFACVHLSLTATS